MPPSVVGGFEQETSLFGVECFAILKTGSSRVWANGKWILRPEVTEKKGSKVSERGLVRIDWKINSRKMVGANVKAETKGLIERRRGLEEEMDAIITRLTAPNAPGLSGSLLDHEGFPRSDIDVGAVRSDRHRLAMLRNDHKEITAKIEQNLQILLSGGLVQDSQTLPQKRTAEGEEMGYHASSGSSGISSMTLPGSTLYENAPTPMDEDVIGRLPFAVVDEIFEGSPAATDGLQLGDRILKFGNVEGSDNLVLRLARESQTNQGHAIPVIVMRHGVQVHLTVTPRIWSGRGLLGCHFQIL